ncbi:MAG: AsmA family protein, partial [Hyphomicrobiales bacterium]
MIVVALVAVLVVPFFIDWSDHRETFEREASALIGHKVTVKGEADAKFLPIPTFTFTDIEVGKKGEQPLMSAGRLKVRVELIALLSRKINVIDMELDAPQASFRVGTDGKTNWALNNASASLDEGFQVKLGPVAIRSGAIYFVDQKTLRSFSVEDIDATVTAQSLIGPWKLEGQAKQGDDPFDFKLATGKFSDNKIRVKTTLLPKDLGLDGIFDGDVLLPAAGKQATGLTYKGSMLVRPRRTPRKTGEDAPEPSSRFELAGLFELDRTKFLLSQAIFEDGAREAPLSLNGSLRVPLDGDVRFQAVVSSRQIDLDRAYGKGVEEPISLQDASTVVMNIIRGLPKPPIPGTISFDVPGVVVGGDVVRSVHFDATPNEQGWKIEDFGAILPGTTRVGFEGLVETGDAFLLDGDLEINSDRPISLARWWRPKSGDDVRRLRVRDFRLSSKISAEENAVRLSDLKAVIGPSDLGGKMAFSKVSERQNRFDANLTAKSLNLDVIQALTALFVGEGNVSGFGSQDVVTVKLQADTMITQAVQGRNALIDLKISDNEIDIGSLKIAEFAGAEIDISGSIKDVLTNPAGRLLGSIKADNTKGLVKLGDALFPNHEMLNHLKRYGSAFVPLDVQVNFSGDQKQDRSASDFAATITGSLGTGDMRAGMRFVGDWQKAREGDVELSFVSTYDDGTALLKQLGWPAFDVGTSGPAEIDIIARGKGTTGIALKTDLLLEEVRTKSDGIVFLEEAKPPRYEMDASLDGQNVEPMLQMLGFTLPASGLGSSGNFSAKLSGAGLKGEFKELTGSLEGQ